MLVLYVRCVEVGYDLVEKDSEDASLGWIPIDVASKDFRGGSDVNFYRFGDF